MTLTSLIACIVTALVFGIGGLVLGRRFTAAEGARRLADATSGAAREQALAVQQARLDAEAGARLLREELAASETRVQGLEERLRDEQAAARHRAALDQEEQRVLQQLAPVRASLGKLELKVS